MFDRAIIPADLYADAGAGHARPPRVIAPLQHIFDPIVGTEEFDQHSARWGELAVPLSRFSSAPRIAFERLPAIPENLAEAMLYYLQLRLIDESLHTRHSLPGLTFGPPAIEGGGGIDGGGTILPA